MRFLFSYIHKGKGKVLAIGGLLNCLTLLSIIYKYVIERVAQEKNTGIKTAQQFVDDCLKETFEVTD